MLLYDYNTELVNKMKLHLFFLTLAIFFSSTPVWAKDNSLRYPVGRRSVVCGTDTSNKLLAYKDEIGSWQGFDADICRNFALAILGDAEAFTLRNVSNKDLVKALDEGQIDIMLGNHVISAKQEVTNPVVSTDVLYIDKQIFAERHKSDATSMQQYKKANVCVVANSHDFENLYDYNQKYAMEFNILQYTSPADAKQAFYLGRCQLISGSEIYIKSIAENLVSKENDIRILPEIISYRPVYAYTAKMNPEFQVAVKWILNAPKLAEQQGITSKNIDSFIGIRSGSVKNLLGADQSLWKQMDLKPDWVIKAIKQRGNFGEIYERNFGKYSEYKIERDKNNLIENGGIINALPFI